MKTTTPQRRSNGSQPERKPVYIVLTLIIIGLVLLISWFIYLLAKPTTSPTNKSTTNSANTTVTGDKKKNKKQTTNSTNTANTNTTTNNANNTVNDNSNANTDPGLVEPTNSNENNNSDDNTNTDDTKETVTLYFTKAGTDCGEVYPVERDIEPAEDFYGQVILEVMHGPTTDEAGYSSSIPAGLYLRQVQYTADGPVITVNETFAELDSCDQTTVSNQLIKTANAMFDLPEDTTGQVVVGTVTDNETDDTEEDDPATDE
ncbi:MAG: hypothetical protein HYV33_05860 [Candidatus Kerfeldbacteria bacterium]|nr:hypothetical protein [Candidatus Kerfeldbacteria bacterium]